jgi:DNA polymerase V
METFELPAISAGFPSPAELFAEHPLDVQRLLCLTPDATRFVRVAGPSMRDAHIFDGDVLVVDQSLGPVHGDIIVAQLAETYALRRYFLVDGRVVLAAAHPKYPPMIVKPAMAFSCWGVVLFVLSARHPLARHRLLPERRV